MSSEPIGIDEQLAAALRGDSGSECIAPPPLDPRSVVERIAYHGIAGLLCRPSGDTDRWPEAVEAFVGEEARGLAMWELRHRQILDELLTALASARVIAILLKGTALAYDLYPVPATRSRGDSDLLVDPADLAATRRILEGAGFAPAGGDSEGAKRFALQEGWVRTCGGAMVHHVDLHWQTLNSPALAGVLEGPECLANRVALSRLGPDAWGMDRVRTLIHTCIHRTLNFSSPYFIGDRTYYGGDRLIWLHDIHLLSRALTPSEWAEFTRLAIGKGVPAACLDGLRAARRKLATAFPATVEEALQTASIDAQPDAYLRARQLGRAWRDWRAIPGWKGKSGYFLARFFPTGDFLRDKYPRLAGLPVPFLYARRLFDLFRARPSQDARR